MTQSLIKSSNVRPVILCGGAGTRLWPLSTAEMPKQFISLIEEDSLLGATIKRVRAAGALGAPLLVGSARHEAALTQAVASHPGGEVLVEPMARNTALAVALAAFRISQTDAGALLWIVPADHHVNCPESLRQPLARAVEAANAGSIVTFGITPDRPATEFGWIKAGSAGGGEGTLPVERFVEKPSIDRARAFLAEGGHYWNSGMFLFKASDLLDELACHAPDIYDAANDAVARGSVDGRTFRPDREAVLRCPSIPVDIAVMERTSLCAMVPIDISWSDVGAWDAVWTARAKNADGNAMTGDVRVLDTRNSLVHAASRHVAVLGLSDVVVVETAQAVLVAHRDSVQDVKTCATSAPALPVAAPAAAPVDRPWGRYQSVDRGPGFQVKHITVAVGGSLSRQKHFRRAEHWVVVAGEADVELDGAVHRLRANQSIHIPREAVHRLTNAGAQPVHLIEVQCGDYLGEDDIVRLDDIYGRCATSLAA